MYKLINKNKIAIILAGLEVLNYVTLKPYNMNVFFMCWTVIFMTLLLYNIFDVDSSLNSIGINDQTSYSNLATAMCESIYGKKESRNYNRIFNYLNAVYLILMICNIIGYMLYM